MERWVYLIPRLIILALITLAVWVGFDPLFRRVVLVKLQDATGAKVEIGHLRYSMSNQKIFLKDVAIADPRWPMRNLLQAEMAYVELNPASLWRRQVVIERGETSRVVFGAPRTDSGALPGNPEPVAPIVSKWEPKQFEPLNRIGLEWLDQFPPNDSTIPTTTKLELVQLSSELHESWKSQLAGQTEKISTLRQARETLNHSNVDDGNPLRRQFVNNDSDYRALAARTKEIGSHLIHLERAALNDRDRLILAFNRDTQKLRQSIRTTSFDSDSVSKLLLTKLQEERVSEIIGWFQWFRSAVPDPQSVFQSKNKRGVDIQLPGVEPRPGFLIKSLDLEGEGRFVNRHINFAGTAYNLTSQPELHSLPASFELRAQGDRHLIVSCTLDRRGERPADTLHVICPDLELSEQLLGEENSMLVTMGPASRIQADVEISVTGDQLSGVLVFRHSNVSLHVDHLHDLVGGGDTALQLNQGLASVDRFETRVTLSGTLEDYEYQFQSDLGSRFASAANQLLTDNSERLVEQRKQELQSILEIQLTKLDNDIMPEIRRLTRLLEQEQTEIASLQNTEPNEQGRLPDIH